MKTAGCKMTFLLLMTLGGFRGICLGQFSLEQYEKRMETIHSNIFHYFYDSTHHLFYETSVSSVPGKHAYLWPMCALMHAANEMEAVHNGKDYLAPVLKAIECYYSDSLPAGGYRASVVSENPDARFYDDNEWIGLAALDAYFRTKKEAYLRLGIKVYRFIMTGYDTISGGGLYWKEGDITSKNTCSNGPAIVLALQLYKATHQQNYLDTALLLYHWTNKHLRSSKGVYYDHIRLPSDSIDKRTYTYNTGIMLQSNVLLYEISKNRKYLAEARDIAKASLNHFYKNGMFPNHYWFNAVLLRGYEALYYTDADNIYFKAMINYANNIWNTERDGNGLLGKKPEKELLQQAAMLEIFARIIKLGKSHQQWKK